ncbi:MAG: hypothetical protein QOJ32_3466, partial [Frankiaceae bacterium]|nr:hypothetical protein [Frankiaceae bacterium]
QVRKPRRAQALRVLLAESEARHRTTTATMLADLGHDVLEAGTAAEALARLLHGVDLVVCDRGLPDMDGLALLDQIRKRLPGVPAVVATGSAGGEAEGVVWLSKPFDETSLRAAVLHAAAARASAA